MCGKYELFFFIPGLMVGLVGVCSCALTARFQLFTTTLDMLVLLNARIDIPMYAVGSQHILKDKKKKIHMHVWRANQSTK